MKILEWQIKFIQHIMELLLHGTKTFDELHVIELSSEINSPATVIKELPLVDYVIK